MPERSLEDLEKKVDRLSDKLDEMVSSTQSIESSMKEVAGSRETEVLFKKIDEILISIKDIDFSVKETAQAEGAPTLGKKIDDLQHYVASLSTLEEKFGDLSDAFAETKEIVGIIVRQLDDIERKYNKTLEDVNRALEMVLKASGGEAKLEPAKISLKPEPKEAQPVVPTSAEEPGKTAPTAVSVDELIESLLKMVRPQTNADRMARALEDTRDKLTALMPGHTPVLYQFGRIARELKSYPPTATLNENDIARLNKEIRGWSQKLKELAKSS